MLAVEFSPYITPYKLFRHPGEDQAFERTLRFLTPQRRFALFSIPCDHSMSRGWYSGIHWRTPFLVPPSRVIWGPDEREFELSYVDPNAPVLPAFETLLGPPVPPW